MKFVAKHRFARIFTCLFVRCLRNLHALRYGLDLCLYKVNGYSRLSSSASQAVYTPATSRCKEYNGRFIVSQFVEPEEGESSGTDTRGAQTLCIHVR
jgi:hypothetical protein